MDLGVLEPEQAVSLLCRLYRAQAHHERAVGCARQALAILEPAGRSLMTARVLGTLGDMHEPTGNRQEPRSCRDRALHLYRQMACRKSAPSPGG